MAKDLIVFWHVNVRVLSPGVEAGEMDPEQPTGNVVGAADDFLPPPLFPEE